MTSIVVVSADRPADRGAMFRAIAHAEGRAVSSVVMGAQDLPLRASRVRHRRAERAALVIGIDRAPGALPLEGSVTDARTVTRALKLYGFERRSIRLLLDGAATGAAVRGGLAWLARTVDRDGVAVVAIATHTRRTGSRNRLVLGDGSFLDAHELARRVGAIPARTWTLLPTCYAAGYGLPGVTGPGRLATFASTAKREAYQIGAAGSHLVIHMVRRAMVEGRAPRSVESAFRFAERTLKRFEPDRAPLLSDGIGGDLVLGRVRWKPPHGDDPYRLTPRDAVTPALSTPSPPAPPAPAHPAPRETAHPRAGRDRITACGWVRVSCEDDGGGV